MRLSLAALSLVLTPSQLNQPLILPDLPAHMVLEDGYETEEEKEDVKSEADADYYPTEKARRKASSKASKGASGSKRKEKPLNIP